MNRQRVGLWKRILRWFRYKGAADLPEPPPFVYPEVKIEYGRRNQPTEATLADPTQTSREAAGLDLVFLRQQMSNFLDEAALRSLSQTLDIDYEALSGGKGRHVLDIIRLCEARGMLPALLDACRRLQPDFSWQPEGN